MQHSGVVAPSYELSDACSGHLGVFLGEVHGYLSDLYQLALAALAEYVLLGDTVVVAHGLEDVVDGQRMIVDLHCTLNNTLGQMHVDGRVIDDRVGHERVDHALQIAHRSIGCMCDILNDIGRDLQAVTTAFRIENVDAKLLVRLFQFGNESAGETCEHAVLEPVEVYRWTVAGQDDLLAQTEEVVEDVEEGGNGPLGGR